MSGLNKTIVALDNMDKEQALEFLQKTSGKISLVKIGMELFYRYGGSLVNEIHQKFGVQIFLDLKLHDIPNTVAKAIASLHGLPLKFLTVHLSGGQGMLTAAREAQAQALPHTQLLGVSHLTSLDQSDFKELWNFSAEDVGQSFEKLTRLCLRTRIHGMILSAHELSLVAKILKDCREQTGEIENDALNLIKICPGIRFADELANNVTQDQKRVATPQMALKDGADYLVIGRSLTHAQNISGRLQELAKIKD